MEINWSGSRGIWSHIGRVLGHIGGFIDFHVISESLMNKEGVSAKNFMYVALYISICNSMLEEFFFRGFAFLQLKQYMKEGTACGISALAFALYHVFIMAGWFTPLLFALLVAGLTGAGCLFNFLDRRGSIYPSWLVHMSANLAINTVGLMMFGIL